YLGYIDDEDISIKGQELSRFNKIQHVAPIYDASAVLLHLHHHYSRPPPIKGEELRSGGQMMGGILGPNKPTTRDTKRWLPVKGWSLVLRGLPFNRGPLPVH